jgi:hypothetical protein
MKRKEKKVSATGDRKLLVMLPINLLDICDIAHLSKSKVSDPFTTEKS